MSFSKAHESVIAACTRARSLPQDTADGQRIRQLHSYLDGVSVRWVADDGSVGPAMISPPAHVNVTRLFLFNNRGSVNWRKEAQMCCNGVVLSYPDMHILATPPRFMSAAQGGQHRRRNVNLTNYHVFSINDGTVVTLYWFADRWVISTAHAHDVGAYKWGADKNYDEVFAEVMGHYPEFSLDKLDKTKSYTIGFRHPTMHPLPGDLPVAAWLIHSATASQLGVTMCYRDNIGLPRQVPLAKGALSGLNLQKKCDAALREYLGSRRTAGADARPGTDTRPTPVTILYGYVLRSKNPAHPDLLFESSLLRFLRENVYNMSQLRDISKEIVSGPGRFEYMALRAYLNYDKRFTFMEMFDTVDYDRFRSTMESIADIAVDLLGFPARDTEKAEKLGISLPAHPVNDNVRIVASGLLSEIREAGINLTPCGEGPGATEEICEVIMDFLSNPARTDIIYSCLPAASV